MIWDSDTVFVLGAGFTKAFLPQAPLLVDDYGADELRKKFAAFPEASRLLEAELSHPDHLRGHLNLERLMTRLVGGMPYDFGTGADKEMAVLLAALKQSFANRLESARQSEKELPGELWLFAARCIASRINCISFNYDDLLDEAFWSVERTSNEEYGWSPDWGYGFPCRSSHSTLKGPYYVPGGPGRCYLLKLHGSINWRIGLGRPQPIAVDSVLHHERWFHQPGSQATPEQIEGLLESEPVIVPPILAKTSLVEQPIMRLIWSRAIEALRRAKRVVFIGYSLPRTDIAASFLFREGLAHLDAAADVTVVDYVKAGDDPKQRLDDLLASYSQVFPRIQREQFDLSGGADWVRDTGAEWLYDSHGRAVAYRALKHIYTRNGDFFGTIRNYDHPRQDIWNHKYKAEIVDGNRLLRAEPPPADNRGPADSPGPIQVPRLPASVDPMAIPPGFVDVDFARI
jgi:SIR2-like domain